MNQVFKAFVSLVVIFCTIGAGPPIWGPNGSASFLNSGPLVTKDGRNIYASGAINLVKNTDAALTAATYTDLGTGTTVSRTTTAAEIPLSPYYTTGVKISNDGSGTGSTRIVCFQAPTSLKNTKLGVSWSQVPGAGYVAGDYSVDVYSDTSSDCTGTETRLSLSTDSSSVSTLSNFTGRYATTFDTTSADYYELRITRVAGSSGATSWLGFSNFYVGPGIQPQGAVVGEWTSFTPTGANLWTTNATYTGQYRRVGSQMELQVKVSGSTTPSGGSDTANLKIYLPSNLNIDFSKLPSGGTNGVNVGRMSATYAGVGNIFGTVRTVNDSTANQINVWRVSASPSASNSEQPIPTSDVPAVAYFFTIYATLPIAEWAGSGTVNLAQNDVEYLWNSDTSDADTTASGFSYGPSGVAFGAFGAGNTGNRIKRVRSQTPNQVGDRFEVEILTNGQWVAISDNGLNTQILMNQLTRTYGVTVLPVSGSATDLDVYFGRGGRLTNASSYGGADASSYDIGQKWRVRKSSAGAAVGFGIADTTSSGLVPSGTYNKSTGAWTLGASGSTTRHTVNGNIRILPGADTFTSGDNLRFSSNTFLIYGGTSGIAFVDSANATVKGSMTDAGAWTLGASSGTTTSHTIQGSVVARDTPDVIIKTTTTTSGATPKYPLAVARQNSSLMGLLLGVDNNAEAVIAANNAKIIFGREYSGSFTETGRINDAGAWTLGPSSGLTAGHTIQNSSSTTAALIVQNSDTGTTASDGLRVYAGGTSGSAAVLLAADSINSVSQFIVRSNGTIVVRPTNWGTGGTAIGVSSSVLTTSPSSRRYKENETPLSIDSSKIYDIEVKEFDYVKAKGGSHDFGAIAEDVEAIIPEIVWKENGQPESIRETKMVWLMLEEMKKLKADLETTKAELQALKKAG